MGFGGGVVVCFILWGVCRLANKCLWYIIVGFLQSFVKKKKNSFGCSIFLKVNAC